MERLNESLQPPEGIPLASVSVAHASVFDPLCFPTQLSPRGCKKVPMPTYMQTSLDTMVAAELINVVYCSSRQIKATAPFRLTVLEETLRASYLSSRCKCSLVYFFTVAFFSGLWTHHFWVQSVF